MIAIPNDIKEIKKQLGSRRNHKGLQGAYQSWESKRSPRTATILLVGLSGAGKSSTVCCS